MKLSFYHTASPAFFDKDNSTKSRIVFSTRTATAMIIGENTWQRVISNEFSELEETILHDLIKSELLVPELEDELSTVLNRNNAKILDNDTLYLVIQPTAACQLGCGYCGQKHTNHKLNNINQLRFIERAEQKLINGKFSKVEIGWFGAEPLNGISVMREMSPKIIELCTKFNCEYKSKIVTNGLSLNEKMIRELLDIHKVKHVEITLDGSKKYHDERRHFKDGSESFDKIFKNIKAISKIDKSEFTFRIRCNVDRRNYEGVNELIDLLAENNLQDRISFYVAPIHSWGNDAHKESLSSEEFAKWEINWIAKMQKLGFTTNLLPKLKEIVCMAVQPDSELIDAHGNLFNCTEVSYVPSYGEPNKYSTGHAMLGDFPKSKELLGNFNSEIKEGHFDCNKCNMLPVCGGHCPKLWKEGIVPCPTPKFNIQERLLLAYVEQKSK